MAGTAVLSHILVTFCCFLSDSDRYLRVTACLGRKAPVAFSRPVLGGCCSAVWIPKGTLTIHLTSLHSCAGFVTVPAGGFPAGMAGWGP